MPTVLAMIETIPPDDTGVEPDRLAREVRQDGETYEQAKERIFDALPDGWRVINLRTA